MFIPFSELVPQGEVFTVEDRPHQIGELAEKFGVTLRTIRFYEERGLIAPRRASARIRLYDVGDVARLSLIVACRRYGLSVDMIADLLALRDREGPQAFQPRLAAALAERLGQMSAEITEAEKLRGELISWLADLGHAR